MKRAQPDIELAVSFLMTRVPRSTEHNWLKLKRFLCYLYNKINEKRYIGANSLTSLFTWIDAAYGVNSNFRSHTGRFMSFGLGTVQCKDIKQRLNIKSSTEAEIVEMSDYILIQYRFGIF